MTNGMFGIDARRYAALAGLIHRGTCNPARWAGLRDAAPLALMCEFAAQVSAVARLRAAQRASQPKLECAVEEGLGHGLHGQAETEFIIEPVSHDLSLCSMPRRCRYSLRVAVLVSLCSLPASSLDTDTNTGTISL
jgi:hypothetical protein